MIELVGNYISPLLGSLDAALIYASATGLLKLTELATAAAKAGGSVRPFVHCMSVQASGWSVCATAASSLRVCACSGVLKEDFFLKK
jgi:hypothetical protein